MKKRKRVVLVGLDGVSPSLIESLLDNCDLPALQQIFDVGAFGTLESTIPYLTPPAWTSMVTGVNPGKHGVYDFFKLTDDLRLKCAWSTDCRSKTIWEILTVYDLKSIVLNVPMTYPPKPLEGILVSGMPAPRVASFPEKLADELSKQGYQHDIVGVEGRIGRETVDQLLSDLSDIESLRAETCLQLMKDHDDWDFCMVVFYFPDRVLHFGVESMDILQDLFLIIDDFLRSLLSQLNSHDLLLIASDHGLVPTPRSFLINQWLINEGILHLNRGSPNKLLSLIGVTRENLVNSDLLLKLFSMSKAIVPQVHEAALNFLTSLPGKGDKLSISDFDLTASSTFSYGTALPVAMLRVTQGNKHILNEQKFSELRERLLAVVDPISGKPVIKEIHRGEEIFYGDYTDLGPDIIVEANEGFTIDPWTGTTGENLVQDTKPLKKWDHSLAGILMAHGGEVKPKLINAQIPDIAPTVLYALGCPIPEYFDGNILTQLFEFHQDVVVEELQSDDSNDNPGYESENDMVEVMRRLRGLGYID